MLYFGDNVTAATAKSLQSCPTLCDPIDGSPLGSAVPEILQARTLEWDVQKQPHIRKNFNRVIEHAQGKT